ncbi:MAG TPA: response regulator [Thermoanaerobaculia bacterium]|nr:response regulator [Thermoanaerobaculia bacterium]
MSVTLLLVEDDVRQSEALRSLFEESSPETAVAVAPTLQAALAHDRAGVDAVLLDLGLPDSSGLDTLTAVVARFAPVPVIVLTGIAEMELGEEAIALGAEDYLEKAIIPPAAIRRVVRHAIRRCSDRTAAAQRDVQNKAVGQLGQLALTNISSATLLGTVCEVVAHVLGVANAMFVERSADGFLVAKTAGGCTNMSWPPLAIDDDSPFGEAIRTNRAVRVDDVRQRGEAAAEIFRQLDAASAVVVPVRTTFTAPEGVLVVWRATPHPFADQDVAFLNAVSNILASTMQRNLTQEALRLSRENMERILDAVPDRIYRFDERLRVQYMNLAAARGLPSVTMGMHIDDFSVATIHRARWRSGLERALASGVAERFDMDSISSTRRYDVSLVPVMHGGAQSVVVVLRDITERMRAQARYETLFAADVVGVFFCGSDGVVTQANRCFLEMIGREPADVTGRRVTIHSLMTPTAQAIHAARLREVRERGVLPPLPGELVHANGSSVPVLLASAVVERAPDEIVTFAVDETATRRAENELRNQTLLLDSARDAIVLRDLDGRICFWNEGARRLYGWSRDEAVGKSMSELVSLSGNDADPAIHPSVFACGEWQGELQQRTKAGAQIVVDSRCSLLPSAYGEPPMMLIINTDITERKSLERQLLHAQRLESLGTLAGGIAHDLNNILMPILMGAESLRGLGVPANAEPTVERIAGSARRGADIIRQLLTFARGHRVDNQMTNPARLVGELQRMLRETIPPSITIETKVDPNIWSIACEPTQVMQVLLNLGVNARDAMPAGGYLGIRAENVEVDEQYANMNPGATPGVYVMLSVSDTGTGIPADTIGRIFDPFFTTKEAGSGTGLGLATVRSIVKNHNGFLNVYSEPGATVFKIYLPALYDTASEEDEDVAPPVVAGNGELILVIDDELAILDVTAATLESFGYRVLTAADGSEGLALYAQNSEVAVVVTDMLMPVLDGPTTIRALRKLNPNVRVVGMSGYTSQRMAGPMPDLLLQKPFRAPDLLHAIQSVLSRVEPARG